MLAGALAGLVEGAAFTWNDIAGVSGAEGGAQAGGLVVFLPFLLTVHALSGLAVGSGLGAAIGVLPALGIAAVNRSAARSMLRPTAGA